MGANTDLYNIGLVFVAIFFIFMSASALLWLKFFPLVKRVDPELHEKIRFRYNQFTIKTPYGEFIFGRAFKKHPDKNIRFYAQLLFWLGTIAQAGFNIGMIIMLVIIVGSL